MLTEFFPFVNYKFMFWRKIALRTTRKKTRDSQRVRPVGQCSRCGGEAYPGDLCWRLGGQTLCEDCLTPWLLAELAPFCTVRGEVGR